jgi:hypothetical protein
MDNRCIRLVALDADNCVGGRACLEQGYIASGIVRQPSRFQAGRSDSFSIPCMISGSMSFRNVLGSLSVGLHRATNCTLLCWYWQAGPGNFVAP